MISANSIKTVLLLGSLSALLLLFGNLVGGSTGLHIALIMALVMNFIAYFFSEKIVLSMYRAQPLDHEHYQSIYDMVQELCTDMRMPMPRLWIVKTSMANAFATGRNPQHASVVLTTGILRLLNTRELRGVLSHELSHIKNRDVLISTVAATLATAIGYLAQMAQYALFWGSVANNRDRRGANPIVLLITAILMPIGATLIQLAISRSREYQADESGAHHCHDPLALASALQKLEDHMTEANLNHKETEYASTSSLFIVNPFTTRNWVNLFSTHPPLFKRIARLQELAERKIRS